MLDFFRQLLYKILALPVIWQKDREQKKLDAKSLQALNELEADSTTFQLMIPIRRDAQFQQEILRLNTEMRYRINAIQQKIPLCTKVVQHELTEGLKSIDATVKYALAKHMSKK